MARWLKQSTALVFRIGPFVDSTDGVTAETALSIAQADIQISKAGGAFAQTSASPTTTHDADGWYQCPLTTTDTGTLGSLTVQVVMSGALPVWEHFMVVPSQVWDSYFGADALQVHAVEISAALITATSIASDAITAAKIADGAIDAATFAAGAINAAAIAADAITAAKVAADVTTEIQSGLATAASLATVAGYIDTEIADIQSRLPAALVSGRIDASVGAMAAGTITAAAHAAGAIDAAALATDAVNEIADGLLGRSIQGGASTGRLVKDCFRFMRNRKAIAAGTLTVYQEDDSTSAWTAAVTTTAGNPVSEVDPT